MLGWVFWLASSFTQACTPYGWVRCYRNHYLWCVFRCTRCCYNNICLPFGCTHKYIFIFLRYIWYAYSLKSSQSFTVLCELMSIFLVLWQIFVSEDNYTPRLHKWLHAWTGPLNINGFACGLELFISGVSMLRVIKIEDSWAWVRMKHQNNWLTFEFSGEAKCLHEY